MDLLSPSPTTNSPLTPVFGDNVQDLLGTGALNVNPTGIIVVNSIADTVDDPNSGVTTLRDAINQANADNGEDLIVFDRSVFSNAQTITLSGTELDITHNLDIIAPRDPLTGGDLVTVSGNKASRVFEIETGATVSIDGLIIADGKVGTDVGGGIKNSGTLTLDSSIVRNNSALSGYSAAIGKGGGIFNSDTLIVNNSTLVGNSAFLGGGGIYSSNKSTVKVSNSTLSGNSTIYVGGGGIYGSSIVVNNSTLVGNWGEVGGGIYGSSIVVNNSTLSGNRGMYEGGGIEGSSTVVNNSTLVGNEANSGGGIYSSSVVVNNSTLSGNLANSGSGIYSSSVVVNNSTISNNLARVDGGGIFADGGKFIKSMSPGSAVVRNTIIAANLNSKGGVNPDVSGDFTSNGYNLIGSSTGSTGFDATGDIVGTSDNPIDPRLAPLDFNGGSTQTIALLPDSPAIGAGDPTVLDTDTTTDQRGLPRRAADGSTDIGAFELSS